MNFLREPPLQATIAAFNGDQLITRETRYLAMPHFLRENARQHRKLVEEHEAHGWGFRVTTETDIGGQHFVIMQTGPITTLIWFDATYRTIYERTPA